MVGAMGGRYRHGGCGDRPIRVAEILRVRDGEVVHVRDYLDAMAVRGVAG
jgi:ketosteroid isomerase-like protein